MDNASYHSAKIEDQNPQQSWRKDKLKQYLVANNIPFPSDALKEPLWLLAREHALNNPQYTIDKLIRDAGMVVLRLPPYHCECNAIEKI